MVGRGRDRFTRAGRFGRRRARNPGDVKLKISTEIEIFLSTQPGLPQNPHRPQRGRFYLRVRDLSSTDRKADQSDGSAELSHLEIIR